MRFFWLGEVRREESYVVVGEDDVTVVLPTLNEGEAIGRVIEELRLACYRNVLIVDDYSTDRMI